MGQGVGRRSPRVMAHTLSYPPHRRIGAELATHGLLRHLAQQGWHALVTPHTVRGLTPRRVDEVHIVTHDLARTCAPDVVLAHLPFVVQAREMADARGVPLVISVHGGPPGWAAARVAQWRPDLVIANSQAMRASLERTGLPVHVLRPPIDMPHDYGAPRPASADAVTLIGATVEKGVGVLRALAQRMPEVPFLVVQSGYGAQQSLHATNITVLPHGTPMDEVWARTRVLLVPSVEESWGMVAAEAMTRGIPVLGSMAAGLAECLGGVMPRADVADVGAWEHVLRDACGSGWEDLHVAALRRGAELDPASDLESTRREIMGLIGREGRVMGAQQWRNTRTGEVVAADPGSWLGKRLAGMPLVWHPVTEGDAARPSAHAPVPPLTGHAAPPSIPAVIDPALIERADVARTIPPVVEPARSAPVGEWVTYAVARGADRAAAESATKATLIALYGS